MSDEERSSYVNRHRRSTDSSSSSGTGSGSGAGSRSYNHGGSGTQDRKADSPSAWLRSPDSRGGTNRRGSAGRGR